MPRSKTPAGYRQVKVPGDLMDAVDEVLEGSGSAFGYRSPSEFVVDAVRRRLEALGILPRREKDR